MSSYPPPDPGSSWPQGSGSGGLVPSEDRNWAVAAHLGSFLAVPVLLGLVAPLLVLLLRGGSSPFVRRNAVESLNFQINAAIYGAIAWFLAFIVIGIPVALAYVVFYAICVILGSVRASAGRDFRYPLTIRLIS